MMIMDHDDHDDQGYQISNCGKTNRATQEEHQWIVAQGLLS